MVWLAIATVIAIFEAFFFSSYRDMIVFGTLLSLTVALAIVVASRS